MHKKLTEEHKAFIKLNHKKMSCPEISNSIEVDQSKISTWCKKMNLKLKPSPRKGGRPKNNELLKSSATEFLEKNRDSLLCVPWK
jgi:transposase